MQRFTTAEAGHYFYGRLYMHTLHRRMAEPMRYTYVTGHFVGDLTWLNITDVMYTDQSDADTPTFSHRRKGTTVVRYRRNVGQAPYHGTAVRLPHLWYGSFTCHL